MAAGGPNDHPISDILVYSIPVYEPVVDAQFRELATLLSDRDLSEFWEEEIGWGCDMPTAGTAVQAKLPWALARAREQGWEVDGRMLE